MKKNTEVQTVGGLAQIDTGMGTIGGEKADMVWEEACENMNESVTEFSQRIPVSDSHVRKVLKDLPPEAFGL